MLKVGSCFTGIGAWEKGLSDLGIEHDVKWYFEIDEYASCAYSAIHGVNEKADKLLSQLDWENKEKVCCDMTINEPKFKDVGNCVKARYDTGIVNQKSEGIGVVCPVLTPDRTEKRQNGRRFKEDGEPMFTLTGQDRHGVMQVGNLIETSKFDNPQRGRIYDTKGISPALNTVSGGGLEPKILDDTNKNAVLLVGTYNQKDGFTESEIACTLDASVYKGLGCNQNRNAVLHKYRIRKLTPLECFRLMGFKDTDYYKAKTALEKRFYNGKDKSNSQMYKLAGNSVVVDVIIALYKQLDWGCFK